MSNVEMYASLIQHAKEEIKRLLEEIAEYADKLARAAEAERSNYL